MTSKVIIIMKILIDGPAVKDILRPISWPIKQTAPLVVGTGTLMGSQDRLGCTSRLAFCFFLLKAYDRYFMIRSGMIHRR